MVFQFQFLWGEEEKWKQTTDDFMVAKCKRSFMDYEEKQDSGGWYIYGEKERENP